MRQEPGAELDGCRCLLLIPEAGWRGAWRTNAATAGATNVEFLQGHIEEIPLSAGSVDVVISNCVLNLSTDKPAVLAEMFRVLRPGGRIGISYVGCIAGALSFTEYTAGLREVGFTDVSVTPTHQAADGMHAAIIRATRPVDAPASPAARRSAALRCSPDASRASHGLLRSRIVPVHGQGSRPTSGPAARGHDRRHWPGGRGELPGPRPRLRGEHDRQRRLPWLRLGRRRQPVRRGLPACTGGLPARRPGRG